LTSRSPSKLPNGPPSIHRVEQNATRLYRRRSNTLLNAPRRPLSSSPVSQVHTLLHQEVKSLPVSSLTSRALSQKQYKHILYRMLLPSVESLLWPSNRRDSCAMKMKLNSILNTNTLPSAALPRTMQYEVPHHHLAIQHHDMSNSTQYTHQNLYVPNGRIKSENGSDRGVSPHNSDPSSRYSSQAPSLHPGYQQGLSGLQANMRYPSPAPIHQQMPMIQHSYHPNPSTDGSYSQPPHMQQVQQVQEQGQIDSGRLSAGSAGLAGLGLPKAFACSSCGKGFARRSDLARHGTLRHHKSFVARG
jgi:hypothetical protein